MGFLFGKTAQGTYVVVAFWIACYYFFSSMFPMWHFAPGSNPGLAGWPVALLIGTLLIVANMISVYLFICLLYTSPSPRDQRGSRMPSSA